ncbi:MAG: peptidoglycan bridge formation glycyltransferase FemA/FemB family protein [Patescibacteria group bacterium]
MENIQKENWNKFVLENRGSFLQSWEWGEFQERIGKRVFRFCDEGWAAQFIENKLPGVNKFYWHCPRGPVAVGDQLPEIMEVVKKSVGKDVIFFRLGPEWDLSDSQSLIANGFKQLPYDIEPSQTLILDITKSGDELLAQMHEKWRYNIRLAERKGMAVKNFQYPISNDQFEKFYELVDRGTSERKEIKHHPKDYYQKQLEINGENVKFKLFVAEYEGKVIAANIVVIFGRKATYLHGATSSEHREVMAPHLLQWEQIKYAKSLGCSEYDFWGIVNEHTRDKRGASWEGFTRFKRGFGGREVNYAGYFDYPLNKPRYWLYRLVQKFRR